MIVNELVSNAIEHAFPAGQAGVIVITFEMGNEQYRLQVSDNGTGINYSAVEPASLGLRIVTALVEQLGGKLTVERQAGTLFTVVAPVVVQVNSDASPLLSHA
jgi:two-component sensor histidine kinase